MINKINVIPDTTASKILFFKSIDLSQLPDIRIVPLYGANGSGKTTLLNEIHYALFELNEDKSGDDFVDRFGRGLRRSHAGIEHDSQVVVDCDSAKTVYYRYRNGTDNFKVAQPRSYAESFDPAYINYKWNAQALSEGQSIIYSVDGLLKGMLKTTKNNESFVDDNTHAIVLLDEIDSGLSLDNLDNVLRLIRRVIRQGRNIQFFMSFNNPYVLRYFPYVVSMYDGMVHQFKSEDEMLDDLKANQAMLDKSRKSRGKYKIF